MTRQGRHVHILIGSVGLVALAACFGFASPAQPQGMTLTESQLILSRLDSMDRQIGWLWLGVLGAGGGGSAIGGMLGTRRRLPTPTPPTTAADPSPATFSHRSPHS